MSDDALRASDITQAHIDTLLARLKLLLGQIETVRAAIAALEDNLELVYTDYQKVVGFLLRENRQLSAEIHILQDQIEGTGYDVGIYTPQQNHILHEHSIINRQSETIPTTDPEALEKKVLLNHLVRVLDHMTNVNDAQVLSQVKGLFENPSACLVDALERVPWGIVWTKRSPREDLAKQYDRLMTWERSLAIQLQSLQSRGERLRNDTRYGLWEQYQKGQDAWQQILQQAVKQEQERKSRLSQEKQQLQAEWEEIIDNP